MNDGTKAANIGEHAERLMTLAEGLRWDRRRVELCWRACAGIPTEALEAGRLGEALMDLRVAAVSQSDEVLRQVVLEALRALGRLL